MKELIKNRSKLTASSFESKLRRIIKSEHKYQALENNIDMVVGAFMRLFNKEKARQPIGDSAINKEIYFFKTNKNKFGISYDVLKELRESLRMFK